MSGSNSSGNYGYSIDPSTLSALLSGYGGYGNSSGYNYNTGSLPFGWSPSNQSGSYAQMLNSLTPLQRAMFTAQGTNQAAGQSQGISQQGQNPYAGMTSYGASPWFAGGGWGGGQQSY